MPIAGAVIVIYGVADYAFDLGGKIDAAVGRDSPLAEFWDQLGAGRK